MAEQSTRHFARRWVSDWTDFMDCRLVLLSPGNFSDYLGALYLQPTASLVTKGGACSLLPPPRAGLLEVLVD